MDSPDLKYPVPAASPFLIAGSASSTITYELQYNFNLPPLMAILVMLLLGQKVTYGVSH